jgi:hypothetical protein
VYNGFLKESMPSRPTQIPILALIFVLPHICSSILTMVDADYIKVYKIDFIIGLPLVMAGTYWLHFMIGGKLAMFVFVALTAHHVLSQQTGIARTMIGGVPKPLYETWRWMLVLASVPLFVIWQDNLFFHKHSLRMLPYNDLQIVSTLIFIMLAIAVYTAVELSKRSKSRIGVFYIWANMCMVLAGILCQALEYFMLAALLARSIHDLTAFSVYITHDYNRNKNSPKALIYRLFHFTKIPIAILCPLVAIAIAYGVNQLPSVSSGSSVFLTAGYLYLALTYFHYFIERRMWKRGTPHREHVAFSY